jgi:hypothetical protein
VEFNAGAFFSKHEEKKKENFKVREAYEPIDRRLEASARYESGEKTNQNSQRAYVLRENLIHATRCKDFLVHSTLHIA